MPRRVKKLPLTAARKVRMLEQFELRARELEALWRGAVAGEQASERPAGR
jgi:hypothetical protein